MFIRKYILQILLLIVVLIASFTVVYIKNHEVKEIGKHTITVKNENFSSVSPYKFPNGIHPIYCNPWLVGGVYNGKVIGIDEMSALLKHTEIYSCYNQSGKYGIGLFDSKSGCIVSKSGEGTPVDVAVCGNWNAVPRKVIVIKNASKLDKDAVIKVLKQNKIINTQPHINKIFRVDLENDGIIEDVICATTSNPDYVPGPKGWTSVKPGDYSFVIVTRVVNGKSQTVFVVGDFYSKVDKLTVAMEYNLSGVYDLDGDGIMEIVLYHSSSDEVVGCTIFRYNRGKSVETGMVYIEEV